jgi:ubiquinone/menaquinone biosynthesis C-methylase UbiE
MAKGSLDKLRELSRAYQPARILLTACELDLFDHLEAPSAADEVARTLKVNGRALSILLDALVGLGLIRKASGLYSNNAAVSTYLVSGKPDYRGAIFKHMANCWEGWSHLTQIVSSGSRPERQRPPGYRQPFILGMHAVARDQAPRLARMLPLPEEGRLLDVGGGPGTYCMAFCRQRPKLDCTLFDLPETVRIARQLLAAEGRDVAGRIRLQEGDFTTDDLGSGFDFVWVSQVLHAYPEAACAALIAKAFKALKAGGVAAVHEATLSETKTSPRRGAIFSVHMLAMTEGRAYSRGEIAAWLRGAGFIRVRGRRLSSLSSLVIGWKP